MQLSFYQLGNQYEQPESLAEAYQLSQELIVGTHPLSIDVETRSLKDRTPIGLSVSPNSYCAFYYNLKEPNPFVLWGEINRLDRRTVYHNCMFDLDSMYGQLKTENLFDTMMGCRYEGLPLQLGEIALAFDIEIEPIKDILDRYKTKDMAEVPDEEVVRKCSKDTISTYRLYEAIQAETNQFQMTLDMRMVPLLLKMSHRGVAVDQEKVEEFWRKYESEATYYKDLCEEQGFNPGSGAQRGYFLATRGNVLPPTPSGRQLVTNEDALRRLDDPWAQTILDYIQSQNMLSKGLKKLKGYDRVYGKYGLNSATGRTTCSGANLPGHINFQQLFSKDRRKEIRNVFIPDSGIFTDWDDSQLELRLLAYASGDTGMLSVFSSGGDIHQDAAERCTISRDIAKNCNYALTYGASAKTIAETGSFTMETAENLLSLMEGAYPQLFSYMYEMQQEGLRTGKVQDIFGRTYYLDQEHGTDPGQIERNAVNYPTQGPASSIFKQQLILLDDLGFDQAIEVHDQSLIDGKVELPIEMMEHLAPFHTPVEVKYTERWEK